MKTNKSEKTKKPMSPLLKGVLKMALLVLIIFCVIIYSDFKGYFNPEQSNDHTRRKWNTLYQMNDQQLDVDVLLVGNSHLYTGVNPKNLSLNLGATSFILASPGTHTIDNYFALKEALTISQPKLVVIETYGMNNINPYELVKGKLSNQFVSFAARKNVGIKLKSTPFLFSVDNYLNAWSTTIRNHDYIFSNTEQLKSNRILIQNKKPEVINNANLYLGRYVRFTTGIEQNVLDQYNTSGAPIDGEEFKLSQYNRNHIQKIIRLCEEENIELLFLTLPMYEKHITNYSAWQTVLNEEFKVKSNSNWMNMQLPQHYEGFETFAFENTYNASQHMTYDGSILASSKLANFIRDSLDVALPKRSKDVAWHQLFYGNEGYFEYYSPVPNDPNNKIVSTKKILENVTVNSLSSLNINNGQATRLIAKIDKTYLNEIPSDQSIVLNLIIQYENGGVLQNANVELTYEKLHELENEVIFSRILNPVNVKGILNGQLVLK